MSLSGKSGGSPANNHARYGSRGTRANSKIHKGVDVVTVNRLEKLLTVNRRTKGSTAPRKVAAGQ